MDFICVWRSGPRRFLCRVAVFAGAPQPGEWSGGLGVSSPSSTSHAGSGPIAVGGTRFQLFSRLSLSVAHPVKTLRKIDIRQCGGDDSHAYWRFEFEANAFLHHMIRNIMGCLLQIGQGLQPPAWMGQVLQARNRDVAAPTFSPDGLYFLGPQYAPDWGLPSRTPAYDWLPCPPAT